MDVSLKPALAKFVEEQVRTGRFASAAEVVEAGLARLMLDPPAEPWDAADDAVIEESERQIADGQDLDWNEVSARLRRDYLGQ